MEIASLTIYSIATSRIASSYIAYLANSYTIRLITLPPIYRTILLSSPIY